MLNETQSTQRPLGTAIRIDVFSHHIKVYNLNRQGLGAALDFCRGVAHFGLKKVRGRFIPAMTKVFVGTTHDRTEFRFHRNELDVILRHFGNNGFSGRMVHVEYMPLYEPKKVTLNYIEKRTPRDYQEPQIEYGLAPGHTKVITARPGRGKTFMALAIMSKLQVLTFFVIKPMYMEKWIKDAKEAFHFKKGELMTVRGSDQLKSVIALALNKELKATVILCSNATFHKYLKDYEKYPKMMREIGYGCTPEDFYRTLGAGLRVIDEVHQDFHLNYRQDLYSHIPLTLSLSGTLESDDKFITERYLVQFPADQRGPKMDDTSHVKVRALMYGFRNAEKRAKFINFAMKSYSHVMFEQSVMKKKEELLRPYVNMICDITRHDFIHKREEGQKMVIYCSTVDLCTIVADRLKRLHPDINVTRYVSDDDYEEMLECDLIVSTLKSLGTAIDIPGLRVILMTDAVSSRQANLQAVERLRASPDFSPEFFYLVCSDIEKHRDYHTHKKEVFRGRVVEHKELITNYSL